MRTEPIGVALHLSLLFISLVFLLPFVWMVSTSLRTPAESFTLPPKWLPEKPQFSNYERVVRSVPFGRFFLNSLLVSGLITVGQLVTCSTAAYAFARLRFPGRDFLFVVLLSSLMIPIQVTIIPIFIIIRRLGLTDTLQSLILPSLISPFGVFLLRQFFLTIPKDLEDAALIDGAHHFFIFTRIILPLSKPALSALAIFTFNYHWNEFFRPLIFLNTYERMTLPLGLSILKGYFGTGSVSVIMAGVALAVLPVLVAFVFAQRYLVEGITLTGMKG
ncbi:MAG: carbohydrate ABC transporter permease [Candidatus Methanomethylicaceae archaeon]